MYISLEDFVEQKLKDFMKHIMDSLPDAACFITLALGKDNMTDTMHQRDILRLFEMRHAS